MNIFSENAANIFYSIVFYCILLYCIVLYCIVLYSIERWVVKRHQNMSCFAVSILPVDGLTPLGHNDEKWPQISGLALEMLIRLWQYRVRQQIRQQCTSIAVEFVSKLRSTISDINPMNDRKCRVMYSYWWITEYNCQWLAGCPRSIGSWTAWLLLAQRQNVNMCHVCPLGPLSIVLTQHCPRQLMYG